MPGGGYDVVGFSASGHLAVYSMVHPDPNPLLNPDYAILVYGTSKLDPINRDWLEKNLYYRGLTDDEENETLLSHVNQNTPPAADTALAPGERVTAPTSGSTWQQTG